MSTVLLIGFLTAACAPSPTATSGEMTIADALDRAVSFDAHPERITVAGRANFIVVDALYLFPEAEERVVALPQAGQTQSGSFIAVVDPAFEEKMHFAAEAGPEQIAATQPDVVLLKSFMNDRLGTPLEALGIPVVYVDLETPEQYERDVRILGRLLGNEARAEEILDFYREQQERVAQGVADVPAGERPRVLLLQYSDRGGEVGFRVPSAGWIQTTMVEQAGGDPVWTEAAQGGGWTMVNFEQIASWDPDQIFIINYFSDVDETVARLEADARWQSLRAIQEGALYAFPKDFYSWDQPDPRWILGLTWLATRIHPRRFADVDMNAEMFRFFEEMYRLDEEQVRVHILPLLQGDVE